MSSRSQDHTSGAAERSFRWPPRQANVEAKPDQSGGTTGMVAASRRERNSGESAWSEFESVFLDVTAPPLPRRAMEAGWTPDSPGRYCPRCGVSVAVGEVTGEGCQRCAGVRFAWDRLVRLGEYGGPLRRWVHEVKFSRWRRLGHDLGRLLGEALLEAHRYETASGQVPLLVAVPDNGWRRVWRGIDHAAVITAGVSAVTGWPVARPLLRHPGRSQLGVPASQRAGNVAGSYGVRKDLGRLRGWTGRVVVVDDVVTTGATMRTCCRLIVKACGNNGNGVEGRVWGACLARAVPAREEGVIRRRRPG
jgi:predicted amidophosphoribosyltransferase